MGLVALFLGLLSAACGAAPLFATEAGDPARLCAVGLAVGLFGAALAAASRSPRLRHRAALPVAGAALFAALIGSLSCGAWLGGVAYLQRRVQRAAAECRSDPTRCLAQPAQRSAP